MTGFAMTGSVVTVLAMTVSAMRKFALLPQRQ